MARQRKFWLFSTPILIDHGTDYIEPVETENVMLGCGVIAMDRLYESDLWTAESADNLIETYIQEYGPECTREEASRVSAQFHRFIHEMQCGDIIVLKIKDDRQLALGTLEGEYACRELSPAIFHVRKVRWIKVVRNISIPIPDMPGLEGESPYEISPDAHSHILEAINI
jgi:predicted Mrr-cat superfamily restriction endonuclease